MRTAASAELFLPHLKSERVQRLITPGSQLHGTNISVTSTLGRVLAKTPLEKALIASSQHRTCLLRHLSTVRIQILPYQPGLAVPRSRVLDRHRPLPDLAVEMPSTLPAGATGK